MDPVRKTQIERQMKVVANLKPGDRLSTKGQWGVSKPGTLRGFVASALSLDTANDTVRALNQLWMSVLQEFQVNPQAWNPKLMKDFAVGVQNLTDTLGPSCKPMQVFSQVVWKTLIVATGRTFNTAENMEEYRALWNRKPVEERSVSNLIEELVEHNRGNTDLDEAFRLFPEAELDSDLPRSEKSVGDQGPLSDITNMPQRGRAEKKSPAISISNQNVKDSARTAVWSITDLYGNQFQSREGATQEETAKDLAKFVYGAVGGDATLATNALKILNQAFIADILVPVQEQLRGKPAPSDPGEKPTAYFMGVREDKGRAVNGKRHNFKISGSGGDVKIEYSAPYLICDSSPEATMAGDYDPDKSDFHFTLHATVNLKTGEAKVTTQRQPV